MSLGACLCWTVVLFFTGGVGLLLYLVATRGGDAALRRDRESHLKIVNEARLRSKKRALTMEEFELAKSDPRRMDDDIPMVQVATATVATTPAGAGARGGAAGQVIAPNSTPMFSIVLFEQEFRSFEERRLRGQIEKAWGVDFPNDAGATEWVVCPPAPAPAMISCGGFQFMVHNVPRPYFTMTEAEVDAVTEQRTRTAIRNSRSFRSVDLMRAAGGEMLPRESGYALIGKLAAELAGNGTLGIYLPGFKRFFPYNDATLRALLMDDVVSALEAAYIEWVPVMQGDDEELVAAMQVARERFSEFEEAFVARKPGAGPFVVKTVFSDGEHTEYMWVEVTQIFGSTITGFLRSSPVQVRGYVQDEEVTVESGDVSDWIAVSEGKTIGNFTGPIIERRHNGNGPT